MSDQFDPKFFCPICTLAFGTEDRVYSTSCGHILHFACLNSWKAKSTSCPQCSHYNPTTHRIYLNYETDMENTGTSTSDENKKKIMDLEREVQEKGIRIQKLKNDFDKFRKSSECREEGLSKLVTQQQLDHQNAQNLLKEVNKSFETIQEQSKYLFKENAALKMVLKLRDGQVCEPTLKTKNKALELDKEIAKKKELSIQPLKPQSYKDVVLAHVQPKQQNSNEENKVGQKTHTLIVIEKVPLDQVKYPLENIVVTVAQKMNVKLRKEEIAIVAKEESKLGITLWVRFKNEKSKQKFFMSKDLLKNNDGLKLVKIAEVSKKIRSLFYYANNKLRGKVFNYIAMKSDAVIAKKNLHAKKKIVIKSRSDVDELLKNASK